MRQVEERRPESFEVSKYSVIVSFVFTHSSVQIRQKLPGCLEMHFSLSFIPTTKKEKTAEKEHEKNSFQIYFSSCLVYLDVQIT